jgi:hypothetical protein
VVFLGGMMAHSSTWKSFITMGTPLFPKTKFFILLLRSALSSSQISYKNEGGDKAELFANTTDCCCHLFDFNCA